MKPLLCVKPGFARDSAVLIAGAAVAQVVIIAMTPIITRLYDQADLGSLGAFVGLTAMLGQLACLRYEQAIMVAEEDEVPALVRLTVAVNAVVALLITMLVWCGGPRLLKVFGMASSTDWLWLIPLVSFALGLFQLLQVLLSRQQIFAAQSQARVAKNVTEVLSQIAWALAAGASAFGLVVSNCLGILIQAGWITRAAKPSWQLALRKQRSTPRLSDVARRYSGFPRFAVPHGLVSTFGQQGFTLVLALLISPKVAGLFYLTHRLLAAPTALISQALAPVFYQRLNKKRNQQEAAQSFIATVFVGLFILGAVPMVAIAAIGPWLFGTCFGVDWAESGRMVRAIWPAYLMMFCTLPITQAFYVYEKQAAGLYWQVSSVILRLAAVYAAYLLGGTDSALIAFGTVGALTYAAVVIMALGWAGCRFPDVPTAMMKAFVTLAEHIFRKEPTPA